MKLLIDERLELEEEIFYLKIFKLFKSYLVLLSDVKEMGIGDVSLGSPPNIKGLKSSSSSFKLFGIHHRMLNSIIAKRSSFSLSSPVLVLSFLKTDKEEEEIVKPIITFLNNCLEKLTKQNET